MAAFNCTDEYCICKYICATFVLWPTLNKVTKQTNKQTKTTPNESKMPDKWPGILICILL